MDTSATLLEVHSGLRWLLIAATIVALVVTLRSMRGAGVGMPNRVVMWVFRIVITLQWVVGALLIVTQAPINLTGHRGEHALTMTVAMALTHIFGGRRASRPLVSLILLVVVLALVLFGVSRLPQGWRLSPSA